MIVYRIFNFLNEKSYIGQTSQAVGARFRSHLLLALKNKGCRHLSAAIRKHGPSAFAVEVLRESGDQSEIDNLERLWIIALETRDSARGYNLSIGGARNGARGSRWSDESRQKLSLRMRGNTRCLGRKHTDETKRAISLALMGHPQLPNSGSFKPGKNRHL